MTLSELQKAAVLFSPAFFLDRLIVRRNRLYLRHCLGFIAVSVLALFVFTGRIPRIEGVFWIFFSFWLATHLLEFFYNSHRFEGLKGDFNPKQGGENTISYPAALAARAFRMGDIGGGFLDSSPGRKLLVRLGLSSAFIDAYRKSLKIEEQREPAFDFPPGRITLSLIANCVLTATPALEEIFFRAGVSHADVEHVAEWIERSDDRATRAARWWSRENLGRISGIGKDWSLGTAHLFERFSREIVFAGSMFEESDDSPLQSVLEELEIILCRRTEANAVVLSEKDGGALECIYRLAGEIEAGTVLPPLEHKRVFLFDGLSLVGVMKEKGAFETALLGVFNNAAEAGDILVVIENFPAFVQSARALGTDLVALMDPYLAGTSLQFIVIADQHGFHTLLETDGTFMRRFEKVVIKPFEGEALLALLEDRAERLEESEGIFFTYRALKALAEAVPRYFSDEAPFDKALDLLVEIVPRVKLRSRRDIEEGDIEELIKIKTGVPIGEVTPAERQTLLSIEEKLHQRVVGQEPAISMVASALRRARGGVSNPNRPMGSFLFLGPTGVGKTETTKALAGIFFNNEDAIVRLDMSEYTSADALDKLIGSFTTGKPGVLTTKIRERQYGVLLLDEFEKASRIVLDLFLQILDEGFFSDMEGKRIMVRTMMIIATSNAGSGEIWDVLRSRKKLSEHKDAIVDSLVRNGVFKPELLNRFDGVILFSPLNEDSLRTIAAMILEKLSKRIRDRGMRVIFAPDIVEYLVKIGTDPKFGARAMNRAVQEHVERIIAEKIILEALPEGSILTLSAADLASIP